MEKRGVLVKADELDTIQVMKRMNQIIPILFFSVLTISQNTDDRNVPDNQTQIFQVKTDLLSLRQDLVVLPEDRKIGPLKKNGIETENEQMIRSRVLTPFFTGIVSGSFPEDLIMKENLLPVRRELMDTVLKTEFVTLFYRFGILEIKGDSATTSFRIKGQTSDYTGTLYLKNANNGWVLEDIEIGISP